jgi:hypothetical protein
VGLWKSSHDSNTQEVRAWRREQWFILSKHSSLADAQAALRELIKRIPVAQPGAEWTVKDMQTFSDEELAVEEMP